MRKPLIVANWKANPDSLERAVILAKKIEQAAKAAPRAEVVIAPPFPFLPAVGKVLRRAKLGAQDVFWGDVGPYTGEVSWRQLKHLKIEYIIIGHSERKTYLGETDEIINKKTRAALEHGFCPILCIGEKEHGAQEIPAVLGEQLKKALQGMKKSYLKNLTVAYEPVWAVSTMPGARADTPDNAFRAMVYIRRVITALYGTKAAGLVRVIYGGSVNAKNIVSFLREGRMQGALVGAASLDPKEFASLVRQAAASRQPR